MGFYRKILFILFIRATYSSSAGATGPSSIAIINIDNFVLQAHAVIEELDKYIKEKEGARDINPTGGASAEHH